MLAALLSGYVIALLAPFAVRVLKNAAGALIAIVPAFLFAFFLQFVPEAAQDKPWRFAFPWGGPGGLEAAFWLDALALYFALAITGLTAIAALATVGLQLSDRARTRHLFALMSLMSSALAFVLADTPVIVMSAAVMATFSVFLALTARGGAPSRSARIPALVALLSGDLALIAALAGLFIASGSSSLSDLVNRPPTDNAALDAAMILLVVGGLCRFLLIPAELRAPRAAVMSEPLALLSYGAAYIPLTLYVALRFAPMLSGLTIDRTILGLCGAVLLTLGGITGLRALRLRTLLGGVTALMMGIAFLQLATLEAPGVTVAMLMLLAHGLGLTIVLLAAQLISGGEGAIDLQALKHEFGQPLVIVLLIAGVVAFAGLVPSLGMLTLSKSLGAGLYGATTINPSLIAFMTVGHALQIGILLRIVRSLITRRTEPLVLAGTRNLGALAGGFFLFGILLALGWNTNILGHLFIDPMTARLAPVTPLGPFWPQGLAIALSGVALITAGLLGWFETPIRRTFEWLAGGLPRRPERLWRGALTWLEHGARFGSRVGAGLGYRRLAAVMTLCLCGVFVWLAVVAIGAPAPFLQITLLPTAAIASVSALSAILMLLQRNCEEALPLLSISGALAALTMLTAGIVDLAYLMILVLLLETAILLILGARVAPAAKRPRATLGRAGRAVLALIAGAGATIVALLLSEGTAPVASWAQLDQFQLWAAIVAVLLVLGVIVTDLNRRRASGAP